MPAVARAADNEAVGWMWVPTTAPPLQLSGGPAVGSSSGRVMMPLPVPPSEASASGASLDEAGAHGASLFGVRTSSVVPSEVGDDKIFDQARVILHFLLHRLLSPRFGQQFANL